MDDEGLLWGWCEDWRSPIKNTQLECKGILELQKVPWLKQNLLKHDLPAHGSLQKETRKSKRNKERKIRASVLNKASRHMSLLNKVSFKKATIALRSGRLYRNTKWPKSDSKVTRADRPQSDLKLTQKWLQTPFLSHFWGHFWVTWLRSGAGLPESRFWVTFGSL